MSILKNFKKNIRLAGVSLLYGMKGVDNVISTQVDSKNGSTISQSQNTGGVFQEMLEEEQTQRVKEMRDEYYRILREAENIHVKVDPEFMKDDWDEDVDGKKIYATATTRSVSDLIQHAKVYDSDKLPIKVIQDNLHIQSKTNFIAEESDFSDAYNLDTYNYDVTLEIRRDGFIPTFKIEKIVKRIVIKGIDDKRSIVELYLPSDAPQFSQKGSMVINKMKTIIETKRYNDQLLDVTGFHFITEKPWTDKGCHSSEEFEYTNAHVKDIVVYDGSIIVRYECDIVKEYAFIGDKYRMKEVDEKYNTLAQREGKTPTVGAIMRRDEYLKQKEENNKEKSEVNENSN